jgi:hypothetical protein
LDCLILYLVGIAANLAVVVAGILVEISEIGGTLVTGRSVWADTLRGTALVTTTFSHFLSGSACCCWTRGAAAAGLRMSIMTGRSLSSWLATAAMLSCTSGDLFFESPEAVALLLMVLIAGAALVEVTVVVTVVVDADAVVVVVAAGTLDVGAAGVDAAAATSRLAARGCGKYCCRPPSKVGWLQNEKKSAQISKTKSKSCHGCAHCVMG